MKRLISSGLMIAFILSALVIVTPTTTNGQGAGLVSSVLSRMEKNRASLKTLRAGISVSKYNSQIGSEDKFHGVVIYMPGAGHENHNTVKFIFNTELRIVFRDADASAQCLQTRPVLLHAT